MRQGDKPRHISIGPQAFIGALYGGTEAGWLTIFFTPSRHTLWFPVTDPIPDLDPEQNCYLEIGIRRQRPADNQGPGKTDDIIATPACGSTSTTKAPALAPPPTRRGPVAS